MVQLLMYMAENFDLYMNLRLADVALGRRKPRGNLPKNMGRLSTESVTIVDGNIFSVKSSSIPGKM